jgi:hypothetical protein
MDGTTARRMADQLGGTTPALTIEQLKVRLQSDAIHVDERTVIFVDEATKLDTGHWAELAVVVERYGVRVRAIGHDGQHNAIRLAGLFSEMLIEQRIPTAELRQIRRHRNPHNPGQAHPWLSRYQVAVDQGCGVDAVAILQEHQALKLYDTRAQAMGGIVEEWNSWRHSYQPTESALIVHGSNSDVDVVNELAQQQRLDAGELGQDAIRAVDRDYLLRSGDVVAVRNAAYVFPTRSGSPRRKRVENGQTAIVEAIDPERDTLRLMLREPGAEPRLVEIDQARLRAEHAAGKRTAAIRLNYALHSFPAQGATVHGTATLAGHWSQAKQETYVGDTRAIYRHTVHVAREDLGTNGTDQDRITRYAQRISKNRQRQASIRSTVDPTLRLGIRLPDQPLLPSRAGRADTSLKPSTSAPDARMGAAGQAVTIDTSPSAPSASKPHRQQRALLNEPPGGVLDDPTEHLLRALGPVPAERVARERWEREATRLEALRLRCNTNREPSPVRSIPQGGQITTRPGPSTLARPSQRSAGRAIGP